MQVSEQIRPMQGSSLQPLFQSSVQPILIPTSYPPGLSQQAFPLAAHPTNFTNSGASYRLSPSIIYQQPVYPSSGSHYVHPQYLVQPAPIVRRPPEQELNPNFDYEQASRLCEAKIIENTIFCVVCGAEYKVSEKEQHIQKHVRKGHERGLNQEALHRLQDYRKKETKLALMVKPIVEPEEVEMSYDPNVYQLVQEIIYEDESILSKKEAGIGQEANNSFSIFDNNVSISHNNPPVHAFDSQPNPFFSKHQQPHQYDIPNFVIPPPQPLPTYEIYPNDHPIIYQDEPLENISRQKQRMQSNAPIANTLNTYQPTNIDHLVEESQIHPLKTESRPNQNVYQSANSQARIIQPEQPLHYNTAYNQKTNALFSQNQYEYRSVRYESNDFKGFPQEINKAQQIQPIERQESFSGPFEIRAPTEQSKKSTEVNVSQFIRDLNAENEELVVEDRKRIPKQSQW